MKQPYFPEEFDKFSERIEEAYNKLVEVYCKNFNVEEVGLILVTHGYTVEVVLEMFKTPIELI